MRLLAPVRLSRLTDVTTSTDTQRISLETWAEAHGHVIVAQTEDLDVSGGKPIRERPGIGPWLTESKLGDWDGIIGHKLDRLFRNHYDFVTFNREVCEKHGKVIISVGEGIDTSTKMGKFIAGILIQFAEWELSRMSERRAEAAKGLRTQGRWGGGPVPFGYQPEQVDDGWILVLDPEACKVITWAADEVIKGRSVRSLCRELDERGVTTVKGERWRQSSLSRILRSPNLTGQLITRGEIVRDADGVAVRREAVLSDDTFAQLQEALDRSKRRDYGHRDDASLLLRVAYCGRCRRPLYHEPRRDRNTGYYRCAGRVEGWCDERLFRREVLEAIVTECLLDAAGDVPMRLKRVIPASDNAKDLAQVDEAISNLEADRYERNLFSGERGAERYAALMSKLEKRQAELSALPVRPELVEWSLTGQTFGEFWEGLSGPERHLAALGWRAGVCAPQRC